MSNADIAGWVDRVIRLMHRQRMAYFERRHWLTFPSPGSDDPDFQRGSKDARDKRSRALTQEFKVLLEDGNGLSQSNPNDLSPDIWFDPALWYTPGLSAWAWFDPAM